MTTGDPAGVGPELCLNLLKSRSQRSAQTWPLIVGDLACSPGAETVSDALASLGIDVVDSIEELEERHGPCWFDCHSLERHSKDAGGKEHAQDAEATRSLSIQTPGRTPTWGVISAETGRASFAYVELGLQLVQQRLAGAIVTGPIHKQAWQAAGIEYPGHTEFFVERTGAVRHAMMLTSPEVTCSLVTTHVGIADVSRLLTAERIVEVIELSHESMGQWLGRPPRLAVLGLNPHAGENGRFGSGEEERIISPAIETARDAGIDLEGPLSPDTAFLSSKRAEIDAYICMYHDQGLIPLKTLAFDQGVNVTLGLPIVRTSVDHGPALDLAGSGRASPASLFAAYELAERWATMRSR